MRRRTTLRTTLRGSVVALCLSSAGCGGLVASRPDPGGAATERASLATADPGEAAGSTEAEVLAARASRDVDSFLKMRQAGQPLRPATAADPADPPLAPPSATVRRPQRIEWNARGDRGAVAGPPTGDRREGEREPGSPTPPEVRQTTLYQNPSGPIELDAVAAPNPATMQMAGPLAPEPLAMDLLELRRELFQRSLDSSQPLRELMAIASMSLVDPDVELQPEAFRDLTEDERALLEKMQSFFRELSLGLDDSSVPVEVVVSAVTGLKEALVNEPELGLPTTALAWRVGGFGDYDAFDRNVFLAQSEQQVILYLELESFTSERNQKGQWVTELSQQLEIYSDRDGIPVWREPWQKSVDVTHNQRRDFYTTQIVTLPPALSVGRYQLKIRVRDEKSGAEAEEAVPIEIVADPKLAAQVPR